MADASARRLRVFVLLLATVIAVGTARLSTHRYRLAPDRIDIQELHAMLVEKRPLLVRILENPTLHEHERFTDLLRATFHLAEELGTRASLVGLEEAVLRQPPNPAATLQPRDRRLLG